MVKVVIQDAISGTSQNFEGTEAEVTKQLQSAYPWDWAGETFNETIRRLDRAHYLLISVKKEV